ncbi:mucin-2-like [Daphnia carinata]|uniref:mucin-2-like n=1 Tax=Daphnia carinata TaxID=120202 RepID=UPI00257E3FEF|nr:mucin-2-like [Daphnia carinata]
MSPLGSSRLMVKCWLTLAVCVAAFWCHPVPDSSNTGASHPSLKVEQLGQSNEFADSDYPDMMTDFLRLSTAMPTVAASTKSFLVNTPSTSTLPPSTTTKTTTRPSTANHEPATAGVATAKYIPTVTTTTTGKPTTAINTTPAIIVETTTILPRVQKEQTSVTPLVSAEKLQAVKKPAGLNEIEPLQKTDTQTKPTAVVAQTTANPSSSAVQQKQIPSPAATQAQQTATTQSAITTAPFNEQWQPSFTGLGQQQAPSAIPPAAVFNQPQQQQMAVGGATAIQQPTNQVQTAASYGPRQQIQVPNFTPMAVANMQQHQPVMQNPIMVQQMMRNPAFQQQQFQMMYQNRVPVTTQTSTNAKQKIKPASTILTPLANPLIGNNRRPVYFVGGNGAPANLLPLSAWPQLVSNGVQTSPSVATASV